MHVASWLRAVALRLLASLLRLLRPSSLCTPSPRAPRVHAAPEDTYAARVSRLRKTEFARLGADVYLDHAGAALYSERQLADVTAALSGALLGNPRASLCGPLWPVCLPLAPAQPWR